MKNTADHLNTRKIALRMLVAILSEEHQLTNALEAFGKNLDNQNRKFTHALVATTLRKLGQIDALLNRALKKPLDADSAPQQVLRLGVAQLYFMDGVEDHAAIDTTVNLMRAEGMNGLTGLTNGVMRTLQRERAANLKNLPSALETLPVWIREKLKVDYPETATELAEAMLDRAALDFRLRPGAAVPEGATKGNGPDGHFLMPFDAALDGLNLQSGTVYVQDGAAQFPAALLAKSTPPEGPVLDMCAAPGGKTFHLMDLLESADIIALDDSAPRLTRMRENMQRLKLSPPLLQTNGLSTPFADDTFAAVLLDAPCSALGTSRRHPEVVHVRQEADLQNLALLQRDMLEEALRILKPGGVLIYAVCSVLKAEGERRLEKVLKKNVHATVVPFTAADIPLTEALTPEGYIRTTPLMELDGFFIARLTKKAD